MDGRKDYIHKNLFKDVDGVFEWLLEDYGEGVERPFCPFPW
jgi:hypothetical protein